MSRSTDTSLVDVPWAGGTWTTPPEAVRIHDGGMEVTARAGSDAWRTTSYGSVSCTKP
jgi:regulation of enolase protein 1 (concanavalin A-like superfamily)